MTSPHDLPANLFPFLIEALHVDTLAVVWQKRVELPKSKDELAKIYIPALSEILGHAVRIRITFADGIVRESPPPSITCSRCERTSYNTGDIAEKYCGFCRDWYPT